MYLYKLMLFFFLNLIVIGDVVAEKLLINFETFDYPTPQGIFFKKAIGVDGESRYVKKYNFIALPEYDKPYAKGVGLFKHNAEPEILQSYIEKMQDLVELSKRDYKGVNRSREISVSSVFEGEVINKKIQLDNAINVSDKAKALSEWFRLESRDIVYHPQTRLETGVLIDTNLRFDNGYVYIEVVVDNPSDENIEIYGFNDLVHENRTRRGRSIKLGIHANDLNGVGLFLDSKFYQGGSDDSIILNKKSSSKFIFKYTYKDFYDELLNQNGFDRLNAFIATDGLFKFSVTVNNRFKAPSVIGGIFQYSTFDKEIDITRFRQWVEQSSRS